MILGGSSIVTRRLGFRDAMNVGFSSNFLTINLFFSWLWGRVFPREGEWFLWA